MRLFFPRRLYGRHGRRYKIKFVRYLSPESPMPPGWEIKANIDREEGVIRIVRSLTRRDKYLFLLHEILHDFADDFDECDLTHEEVVERLAGELYECFTRNKLGFR